MSTTSTSPTSPIYFTGVSTYSNDFQQIISRQVQIAELPITALQQHQTDNISKSQLLSSLDSAVAALGSSIASLGSIGANQGLVASSSDASVSVTNTGSSQAAAHTISSVTSLATSASELSLTGYADSTTAAVSNSGSMQLVVGGTSYSISLTSGKNNLSGLCDAIKASGAPVTATILNTGSGSTPEYLELAATNSGATTLQLNDLPGNGANPVALIAGALPLAESGTASYADTDTTHVSANGSLKLVLGSNSYAIALGSGQNNLQGLMDAINSSGADVTASIADAGAGAGSSRYSLLVTSNHLGDTTLQLNDVPTSGSQTNLLSTVNNNATQGSNAVFNLDGVQVTRQRNTISDVIPGLTFALNYKPTSPVTLSVASDASSMSDALSQLATNYNAVVDQIDAQRGQTAGLLAGDFSINAVSDDMRQLTTYQASGTNGTSLASLGITFDTSGKMSFDPSALQSFTPSQLQAAFQYLGSSTTGFGAIASQFTQLTDPISGLFANEENGLNTENRELSSQMTTLYDRLTAMQTALTAQVQAADAACANLESQQQVLTASVQSVDLALYGKNFGSASS